MSQVKPCVKCRSDQYKMRNCGYSSFDPHWVECADCGHQVKQSGDWGKKSAICTWNKMWEEEEFIEDLQRLRNENEDLKKENSMLWEKLYNICGYHGDYQEIDEIRELKELQSGQ